MVPNRATVERQFTQRARKGDTSVGTLTYRQYPAGRERGLLVNGNSDALYFPGLQNHCRRWLQPWIKTFAPWKKSCEQPRQHIEKQRHYLYDKGLYNQRYGFSSSYVWMWELDHKESWAPKNWYFWMWCWRRLLRVLWTARSIHSILKEISPEYSLEQLMLKLKLQSFGPLMRRTESLEKTDDGKEWREEKGTTEDEMVGWHHWLGGHEFEQTPGVGDG